MSLLSVHLRSTRDDSYKIVIEPGSLAGLPKRLLSLAEGKRIAVVTDRMVEKLYGKRLLRALASHDSRTRLFSFPSGERAKTRRTKERLEDALLSSGYGRDSLLVALGGGVVGDLVGFLAATLHRGVPFVQVPTTLLAMADSSVGGKTGVDTPAGKNLIGAFWQPLEVVMDPLLLSTLPRRQITAGAAEIAKHGVIADKALFHFVEKNLERLLAGDPQVVSRALLASCKIKAGVVSKDEREGGLRQILNFGHTIAHALELARGYQLLHG
ncbi:MAG: 3-dehydroquinate synthase family protein, partial [Bdellovibrionota bacterium]